MMWHQDSVDRAIDEAARQMTTGEPSARFAAEVLARIEQSEPEPGWLWPRTWRRRIAMAGALGLGIAVLVSVSWQRPQSVTEEPSIAERTVSVAEKVQPSNTPNLGQQVERVAPMVVQGPVSRTSGVQRRETVEFSDVPAIELDSIVLDPIEMAGIGLARLEIAPITIDPVSISRQETP